MFASVNYAGGYCEMRIHDADRPFIAFWDLNMSTGDMEQGKTQEFDNFQQLWEYVGRAIGALPRT